MCTPCFSRHCLQRGMVVLFNPPGVPLHERRDAAEERTFQWGRVMLGFNGAMCSPRAASTCIVCSLESGL